MKLKNETVHIDFFCPRGFAEVGESLVKEGALKLALETANQMGAIPEGINQISAYVEADDDGSFGIRLRYSEFEPPLTQAPSLDKFIEKPIAKRSANFKSSGRRLN